MSKVKVNEFHKVHHEQHHKLAASHATMMAEHEAGTADHTHHKAAHEAHSAISAFHKTCMEKTASDEMNKVDTVPASLESAVQQIFLKMFGNAVMPTNVSVVAPNRLVPRGGQPAVPAAPNVPEQFAKLVAVDESEEQDSRLM
jgi:hypothetical protein